ncbi:hypothetical protein [Mesorhizobium sp.]|uniref:hypothetical protein n=1 Tax=Mesorhizobium sp. TaxID=1871066 RepID=UPI000FE6C03C|nr:hypothetical protein [Mesorhizobium sp.]RWP72390.1 MAG: hypothetical protein EOR09_21335 [Mesorhizobium sp.]
MLIAVLVTDKPSLAPLAVSEFGRLPAGDRIMSEIPTPEGAVFSGLTDSMSLEETLAGVIEGTAAAPLEHRKLLSRNLKLSCNPTDLTAGLTWCDGRSSFSAGGPWLMLLMDRQANAQRLDEIAAEQEAARIRARVFAGYGSRIKTVREVDGDLLMEVADLFRRAESGETRMAG